MYYTESTEVKNVLIRKVFAVGNAVVIAIPRAFLRKLRLVPGMYVVCEMEQNTLRIWRIDDYARQQGKNSTDRNQ